MLRNSTPYNSSDCARAKYLRSPIECLDRANLGIATIDCQLLALIVLLVLSEAVGDSLP